MKCRRLMLVCVVSCLAASSQAQDMVAQGAVVNNLAKIFAANLRYQELYKKKACDLQTLGSPETGAKASDKRAGFLESALVTGKVDEYEYTVKCGEEAGRKFSVVAKPMKEGHPYFCTDADGATLRMAADEESCETAGTLGFYDVAVVKEYCSITATGLMEGARCVANAVILPNLQRSRVAANETAAVANLRTLNTAEVTYENDKGSFAPDLKTLAAAGLVDATLGCAKSPCEKSGYRFTLMTTDKDRHVYFSKAVPVDPGKTGERSFCSADDTVIRWQKSGDIPDMEACVKLDALQ